MFIKKLENNWKQHLFLWEVKKEEEKNEWFGDMFYYYLLGFCMESSSLGGG